MHPLLWSLTLFVALLATALLYEHWPRSTRALFDHHNRRWIDSCRRRGLTGRQMHEEMQFRRAMAATRHVASEAVMTAPESYREAIASAAGQQAQRLSLVDRAVARRFLSVVDEAPLADLLYPGCLDLIARRSRSEAALFPTAVAPDDIAAQRTL